jgi:perosamine synthetase
MIIRRRIDMEKYEFFSLLRNRATPSTVRLWEKEFAKFIGVPYAKVVQSGRAGLFHILSKLIKPDDEVIVPAYTLKDLSPIIRSTGAKIVFADIDKETFNVSPDDIQKKVSSKTRVIIATHIFGSPCDIVRICEIAKDHNILVIEDCAHSAGAILDGRQTGSFGDAAIFSFENIKPINTYGGGMVVAKDKSLLKGLETNASSNAKLIQKAFAGLVENTLLQSPLSFLPLYLMSTRMRPIIINIYRTLQRSTNKKTYSGLQAWLGLKRLLTINYRIRKRRRLAALYGLMLKIPAQQHLGSTNHYFFVALYKGDTMRLKRYLAWHQVDIGVLDEITDDCSRGSCRNSQYVFQHAIQLPLHEAMTTRDVKKICTLINSYP